MGVLLEEHPGECLRPPEAVVGEERRALGEVEEDGVRLGKEAAVFELQDRDAAVRVHPQELRGAGLGSIYVVFDAFVGNAELR